MDKYRLWVATIGDDFEPGVWESLQEAGQFCVSQGGQVVLVTVGNRCVTPFHGLAMMRNEAILDAIEAGATHLCMMDTDMLIEDPSTLHRWVFSNREHGTTVPFIDQTRLELSYSLAEPLVDSQEPHKLDWAVMSCCLYDLGKLARMPLPFFQDFMAIGEEVYYWKLLRRYGIECILDPSVRVTMLRPPTPMWDIPNRVAIEANQEGRHIDFHVRYFDGVRS